MRRVQHLFVATVLIGFALVLSVALIPVIAEAFTCKPLDSVMLQPTELGAVQRAKGIATLYECPGAMTVLEVKVVSLAPDGTQFLVAFTLAQNPADPLMSDWFTMARRHGESYLWDLPLIAVTPGFPTVSVLDENFEAILTGTF